MSISILLFSIHLAPTWIHQSLSQTIVAEAIALFCDFYELALEVVSLLVLAICYHDVQLTFYSRMMMKMKRMIVVDEEEE
jgi:hypothetical protein